MFFARTSTSTARSNCAGRVHAPALHNAGLAHRASRRYHMLRSTMPVPRGLRCFPQIINDIECHTVAAASSQSIHLEKGGNKEAASAVGRVRRWDTRCGGVMDRGIALGRGCRAVTAWDEAGSRRARPWLHGLAVSSTPCARVLTDPMRRMACCARFSTAQALGEACKAVGVDKVFFDRESTYDNK